MYRQSVYFDPDGDIVRRLMNLGHAKRFDAWPCYHTDLQTFSLGKETVGILGCVVGAPFAVLVAEELFACGCRILISLTLSRPNSFVGHTALLCGH